MAVATRIPLRGALMGADADMDHQRHRRNKISNLGPHSVSSHLAGHCTGRRLRARVPGRGEMWRIPESQLSQIPSKCRNRRANERHQEKRKDPCGGRGAVYGSGVLYQRCRSDSAYLRLVLRRRGCSFAGGASSCGRLRRPDFATRAKAWIGRLRHFRAAGPRDAGGAKGAWRGGGRTSRDGRRCLRRGPGRFQGRRGFSATRRGRRGRNRIPGGWAAIEWGMWHPPVLLLQWWSRT